MTSADAILDRPFDVLVMEEGLLVLAPNGASVTVTLRAAEESATRLLSAVRREREQVAEDR